LFNVHRGRINVLRRQHTEETSSCHKTEYFKHCKKINKRTLGLELKKTKPDSLIIKWQWPDWNIDSDCISIKMPKWNMQSTAPKCSRLQALKMPRLSMKS